MKRDERKAMQDAKDAEIRKSRKGQSYIVKGDSLNTRARKLGLATDMPLINRQQRRMELRKAIPVEFRKLKAGKP